MNPRTLSLRGKVQRKVSNCIAGLAAAGSSRHRQKTQFLSAQGRCRDPGTRLELRFHRDSSNASGLRGRNSAGSHQLAWRTHSITSSARSTSEAGTSYPIAFAAFKLMTSSNHSDQGPSGDLNRSSIQEACRAQRDATAWLGMKDSNSEMSSQIIPLKDRIDLRESNRILATKTSRV